MGVHNVILRCPFQRELELVLFIVGIFLSRAVFHLVMEIPGND
jgi:hypothetical protein